jgi:hypothetical protein
VGNRLVIPLLDCSVVLTVSLQWLLLLVVGLLHGAVVAVVGMIKVDVMCGGGKIRGLPIPIPEFQVKLITNYVSPRQERLFPTKDPMKSLLK